MALPLVSCPWLQPLFFFCPLVYICKSFNSLSLFFTPAHYFSLSVGLKMFFILCSCSPFYQIRFVWSFSLQIKDLYFRVLVLHSSPLFYSIHRSKNDLYSLFLFSTLSDLVLVFDFSHFFFSVHLSKIVLYFCSYSPFHPISGFHLLYWSTVILILWTLFTIRFLYLFLGLCFHILFF